MDNSNFCNESSSSSGEIRNPSSLSDSIGKLYLNQTYSDLTIIVENEKLFAHKIILAVRSEYFRALLFGGLREASKNKVVISGRSVETFKNLLKYIYTGSLTLNNLKIDLILELLGLAHEYLLSDLEDAICGHLKHILTTQNSCLIYEAANLYSLTSLMQISASFIDLNAETILLEDSFQQLSWVPLKNIISRDSFFASELSIFKSVSRWIETNSDISQKNLLEVLHAVRLPLMSILELLREVKPTGLISYDKIFEAIEIINTNDSEDKIHCRGLLRDVPIFLDAIGASTSSTGLEENFAVPELGASVLEGIYPSQLLNGNSSLYDGSTGYSSHYIQKDGILIELGNKYLVNHIKMLLWDKDPRLYSYYIEVSVDRKKWTRVIDHSLYSCRSWQYLYFTPRVVKYVRIFGTKNTMNEYFHVVHFEIMNTNTSFMLEEGILVPKHNVATCKFNAQVIEGVNKNFLLDGNTEMYDGETGYTSHKINDGCILIQLGQPYIIDSVRLLLWDRDERLYSYYIETSIDKYNWEIIVDKTQEQCSSWQTHHFERKPIVFIRIVGTNNTANDKTFRVVHFECPAQIHNE